MTTPPLPESPCVRVRLDYTQSDGYDAGSRFFLSYAGSAPTTANCQTLAADVAAAWAAHLAPQVGANFVLTEVDVIDIATVYGNSGDWTGEDAGSASGPYMPAQTATNIEYDIGRRYRGGKPRMFLPPGNVADTQDAGHWSADYVSATNAAIAAFFAEIESESIGAMGALGHVSLSYYLSFTNVTNSSGRTRAAPKYRTVALVDTVTGYSTKGVIGSQRRRRIATTH